MKSVIKMEWYRFIHSKWLMLGMLIEGVVAGLQVVTECLPWIEVNEQYPFLYPLTSYEKWIGNDWSSIYSLLYFMLAPILMSLPYGGTLQSDIRTGYIKSIVTRVKKRDYYLAKYLISFCAGLFIMIPFMLNFCIVSLLFPSVKPQPGVGYFAVLEGYLWADLFYSHPLVYISLWMIMDVIVLGLFASLSIGVTWLTRDYFVSVMMPFICCMILFGLNLVTNISALAPQTYLRPSQPDGANIFWIIVECTVIALFDFYCYMVGKRRDVF